MKIKYKKLREKNRRLRAIEQWIKDDEPLDIECLQKYQRDYVKFRIQPWCNLTVTNSLISKSQGIFRERFLAGLAHIYHQWKSQLDGLNQLYYLEIWLFEHDLKRSQVVCTIGQSLYFYDNSFEIIENSSLFESDLTLWPIERELLETITWQKSLCYEEHISTVWLGA